MALEFELSGYPMANKRVNRDIPNLFNWMVTPQKQENIEHGSQQYGNKRRPLMIYISWWGGWWVVVMYVYVCIIIYICVYIQFDLRIRLHSYQIGSL
jgi:hypothetical protein